MPGVDRVGCRYVSDSEGGYYLLLDTKMGRPYTYKLLRLHARLKSMLIRTCTSTIIEYIWGGGGGGPNTTFREHICPRCRYMGFSHNAIDLHIDPRPSHLTTCTFTTKWHFENNVFNNTRNYQYILDLDLLY